MIHKHVVLCIFLFSWLAQAKNSERNPFIFGKKYCKIPCKQTDIKSFSSKESSKEWEVIKVDAQETIFKNTVTGDLRRVSLSSAQ